jgi:NADH dehydrogenase/NADH:ubiquinone oxidoreductase subunit G
MCLIELKNSPKPVVACSLPVLNNMILYTNTPLLKKARENILENLLLNHPLDCPICDQGGECDLQDQVKHYGSSYNRFFFKKRAIEDKNFSPLIKTIMTRCIHCTRCVRFSLEVLGLVGLGTLKRGSLTEIGTYSFKVLNSEMMGNIVDLCPVGALTLKSYSFKARPWELKIYENIDITDSLGSNLYIHLKESEIFRINPKANKYLNLNFISDNARFFYPSLHLNRLQKIYAAFPYTPLCEILWDKFKSLLSCDMEWMTISLIFSSEVDFDTILYSKFFSYKEKNIRIYRLLQEQDLSNFKVNWLINPIRDFTKHSNFCFIFFSNLKVENTVLNSRLRLKYVANNLTVFSFSNYFSDSNIPTFFINLSINYLLKVFEYKHFILFNFLVKSNNTFFFFNEIFIKRGFNISFLTNFLKLKLPSSIIYVLKSKANSAAFDYLNLELFSRKALLWTHGIFFVGFDDVYHINRYINSAYRARHYSNGNYRTISWLDPHYADYYKKTYWFNTHGSSLAKKCEFIVPILGFLEETKIYINMEGLSQISNKIIPGLGDAKSFLLFIKTFLKSTEYTFFFFYMELIKTSKVFYTISPLFSKTLDECANSYSISLYPVKNLLEDFYRNCKQTKTSSLLLSCSQAVRLSFTNF